MKNRERLGLLAIVLAALATGACRRPQLMLRVETDMRQGAGATLGSLRVRVFSQDDPGAPLRDEVVTLGTGTGEVLLPEDLLGISPRGGDASRTVTVEVEARAGTGTMEPLFTHRVRTAFVSGQVSLLRVFLADRCRTITCPEGFTCGGGTEACEPETRTGPLPRYEPLDPARDAAVDGGPPLRPKFFAADSIWNRTLTAATPLAADQGDAARLQRQVSRFGTTVLWAPGSTPVYTVPAGHPTVTVTDTDDGAATSMWGAVPWPTGATSGGGFDQFLVLWQPSTDTLWEFYKVDPERSDASPGARHGGRIDHVSTASGIFPYPWGAAATGLALVGGLLHIDEALVPAFPHALCITVAEMADAHVAPANRSAERPGVDALPAGRMFRLPADYDVDALLADRTPFVRAVARAARDHGLVVCGLASVVQFRTEDPRTRPADPWPMILGGQAATEAFSETNFPWDRLQVLAPPAAQ